ncbi:MAG: ABC transporter permease, partial [Bacteroidales bacterium]|nr:ABC transporter permease [Bacteroidales bacterium]
MFRVITVTHTSTERDRTPFTPGPLGIALKEEFPQIKDVTRYSLENRELLKTNNYSDVFKTGHCDKSFFDIFSFKLIKGSLESFNYRNEVIIITNNTSKKLFGNEDPIGKVIKSSYGFNYLVIGIMEDLPKQSHIQFDALTPFSVSSHLHRWSTYQNYQTYVLIKKNARFNKNILKRLRYFLKDHIENYPLLEFQSLNDIHLNSDFDDPWVTNKGDKRLIFLLISAAIILISVMLFNYFNLTTSLYISRTKEFSIKKVFGLNSDKILYGHIIENIFFILISVCA